MENIQDIKRYSNERTQIRINCFGYTNTRITRIKLKQLKGFIKQYNNQSLENIESDIKIIQKEIEFRLLCLSLKSVFDIQVK
jgi:hypothetical protein